LAVAGLVVGLSAAHYWWKASKVEADPGWRGDLSQSAADALRPIRPPDPQLSQEGWLMEILNAARESARLNKTAACLTAVAVLLSALSSVLASVENLH
jgi:hypothetical protein